MAANLRLPYLATAALSGLLFGAGLYVSQMVDPLKVLRFLDFTAIPSGGWDPSLAFVIVPAIAVMFIAAGGARRRSSMRSSMNPSSTISMHRCSSARRCSGLAGVCRASARARRSR